MKGSITTSAIVHASLLAFALVSLGSPEPLDVSQAEALPVELVPVEELSQIQQGDKNAPKAEKSAPVPTTRPDIVENAQNAGNNTTDIQAPPTPTEKPNNNESAAAPPKAENPLPVVDTKPNEVKDIVKEETSAPKPQEMAALPQTKPEVAPQPKPEPTPPQETKAEEPPPQNQEPAEIPVPQNVPRPNSRPEPPKPEEPKQAETKPAEQKPTEKPAEKKPDQAKSNDKPSDKKPADKKQETAKSAASQASEFNADEISALLNKQAPSGGGAKRSTETASLGGKKTLGTGLSASEIDNVKGQIQNNWSMVSGLTGVAEVRVVIKIELDQSGNIVGQPEVSASGGPEGTRRAVESSARRAILRSAPLKNMPIEKYEGERGWNTMVLNFDPSEFAL
ncbi:hypothetical protein [Agrobacterium tumefaciens]|uniref:hypothetical protein n=1 Tax=Agrobacterium tumefaciens TaxID=358 RepID=UPI00287D40A1|nr:hypothetical protein [Agrobacterium tumefaciens]MDS7595165.1 hypothetical protein [Agrobacterium tumefaciens]